METELKHPFLAWSESQAFEDGYDDGRVGKLLNPYGHSQGELVTGASRLQWVAWKRGNFAGHLDREDVKKHVAEMVAVSE